MPAGRVVESMAWRHGPSLNAGPRVHVPRDVGGDDMAMMLPSVPAVRFTAPRRDAHQSGDRARRSSFSSPAIFRSGSPLASLRMQPA